MSKIILIQPNFKALIVAPILGIGYLGAVLKKAGHQVKIIDSLSRRDSYFSLQRLIREEEPDIVGLTTMTICFQETIETIRKIKEVSDCTILIGGSHVTALPGISLKCTEADFALIGECESTIVELINRIERKEQDISDIPGICYENEESKIVLNRGRKFIDNLDDIPFPLWEELDPNSYPPSPHGGFFRRYPIAPIITSRGCSFKCKYCTSSLLWQRKFRKRTAINVCDEMELLIKKYGVREIHFEDDNLTGGREHITAICEEMIRRKLDVVWACPNGVRADSLDKDLLRLMKRAGCYCLGFGIESFSQEIMDSMNKQLNTTRTSEIVKAANDVGIETWGFFIIGLPGETKETFERTVSLSLELPFDRANFSYFAPLPGTYFFDQWIKDKDISSINWRSICFLEGAIWNTDSLTTEELTRMGVRAFRRFWLRPKTLTKTLLKIKPRQVKWMFARFMEYFIYRSKSA